MSGPNPAREDGCLPYLAGNGSKPTAVARIHDLQGRVGGTADLRIGRHETVFHGPDVSKSATCTVTSFITDGGAGVRVAVSF